MADDPNIVVAPSGDGRFVAVMHLFDKVRTVFGRDLPHLAQQMRSVAISEFGVLQEDAAALVDRVMAKHSGATSSSEPSRFGELIPKSEQSAEPAPAKEA